MQEVLFETGEHVRFFGKGTLCVAPVFRAASGAGGAEDAPSKPGGGSAGGSAGGPAATPIAGSAGPTFDVALNSPWGVAASKDVLVIGECYGHCISVVRIRDGMLLNRFGNDVGELQRPRGLRLARDGVHGASPMPARLSLRLLMVGVILVCLQFGCRTQETTGCASSASPRGCSC